MLLDNSLSNEAEPRFGEASTYAGDIPGEGGGVSPLPRESSFLYHEECPRCAQRGDDWRGDNLARYDDGHGYCFCCGYYEEGAKEDILKEKEYTSVDMLKDIDIKALVKRGLTEKTCSFFSYGVGNYKGKPVHVASYFDESGTPAAQHIRFRDKSFKWAGDFKRAGLFGSHLWKSGGRRIVITEGEIDAMTIAQLQECKWPVVSIKSGANGAARDIKANIEWLESFEHVVFAFDMDEPGRKAAKECALLLSPNKALIAWLPAKDANECLKQGKIKELINALWQAKAVRPDGIVSGEDIKAVCEASPKSGQDIPYEELNKKILGVRGGELLMFTAGSGIGKSTLVHEITYHLHQAHNVPVGLFCLEENVAKTGRRWVGMGMDKNIVLPEAEYSKEEFEASYQKTIGCGDWYAYNHFGSLETGNLLSKIRYMAVALGVRVVMLDHISIVVSGLDTSGAGDERKIIDVFMTQLRSLIEETGITVLAVVHLKRPENGKSWNEGRQVSLTNLRGSGGLEQLSDIVVALERDQQGDEAEVAQIRVLKNRHTGDCGAAGFVKYDRATGRLVNFVPEDGDHFNEDETEAPF